MCDNSSLVVRYLRPIGERRDRVKTQIPELAGHIEMDLCMERIERRLDLIGKHTA